MRGGCIRRLYSSITPRLLGQISISGVDFFVSKSLLGIERLANLKKIELLKTEFGGGVRAPFPNSGW